MEVFNNMFLANLIIECIFAFLLSILIHESGHFLCALQYKWSFIYMIVGPVRVYRENRKLHITLEKNPILWGGVTLSVPTTTDPKSFKEFSSILLMGPLSSLVAGVVLIPLFLLYHSYFFLLCSCISLSIGIICIIPLPLRTGIGYSDGYRFFRIRKKSLEYNDEYVLFQISIIQFRNPQISYEHLFHIASSLRLSNDAITLYYIHYILYQVANEQNNSEGKQNELAIIKDLYPQIPKSISNAFPISL